MPVSNLSNVLNAFGKRVVKESKTALTKKKKNASKALYNSINYTFKESKNSFQLSINMEDYGKFIDKGVKGVGGTKADGSSWAKKKVTNNLYKYTTKKPPYMAFNGWTISRSIAPRNSKGQFTSRKSILIAIANSVYHTGLETTDFFTKPSESAYKDLLATVADAYALDMDKFLDNIVNN